MQKLVFFFLLLFGGFKVNTNPPLLKIVVKNIQQPQGSVKVALFLSSESFLKDYSIGKVKKVTQTGTVVVEFEYLPKGTYAVSAIHDINNNGKLDKNFLGIPKEPYGFSNGAQGKFGPPAFEEAKINFREDDEVVEVSLR
ncbi:DUF2141 domain-containing protein [Rapidithrix thailandica]|uniref:DUF2141 domain-containing protein n=1 Tax=Rapidithrix thailandica TaxID=413964 RepID=A0AAW9RZL2_9BACT